MVMFVKSAAVSPKVADSQWLSTKEAAQYLGVGEATIQRWVREGRLKAYRFGQRVLRIRRSDLEAIAEPIVSTPSYSDDLLRECQELTESIRLRREGEPAGDSAVEVRRIRLERANR